MNEKIDASLAPKANLEQLKNQAKRLLKESKEQSPHALQRLKRAKLADNADLKLADAQLAIARENGHATWSELKSAVESNSESSLLAQEISIQGIDQIWLDCADLETTESFYSETLKLNKSGEAPGQMLFYDCGDTKLVLGKADEHRPNSILYFKIGDSEDDIQNAFNSLKSAGVKVGDSPHCIARNWNGFDVWVAFFFDPSGNQLAFKTNVPVRERS